MSQILSEVLESNRKYAAEFGEKGSWLCLRRAVSLFSPAWTPGSIPPSLRAWRKATPT